MAEKLAPKMVRLDGLTVSETFIRETWQQLNVLKTKSEQRFFEAAHMARNPDYLLTSKYLKELQEAGILGSNFKFTYLKRLVVLHLITGSDRTLKVISKIQLEKMIADGTH